MSSFEELLDEWQSCGETTRELEEGVVLLASALEVEDVTLSGADLAALARAHWHARWPRALEERAFGGTAMSSLSGAARRPKVMSTTFAEMAASLVAHLKSAGVSFHPGSVAAYVGAVLALGSRERLEADRSLDVHALAMLPVERLAQLSPDAEPDTGVLDSHMHEWLHGLAYRGLPQDWAEEAARRRYLRQQHAHHRAQDVAVLVSETPLSDEFATDHARFCGELPLTPSQVLELWRTTGDGLEADARSKKRAEGLARVTAFTFDEWRSSPSAPLVHGHVVGWLMQRHLDVDTRTLHLAGGYALGLCEHLGSLEDVDDMAFALLSAHFAGINWADEHVASVDLLLELALLGWLTEQTGKRGALLDYLALIGLTPKH